MKKDNRILEVNFENKLMKFNIEFIYELKNKNASIKAKIINANEIYNSIPIHKINEYLTNYSREFLIELTGEYFKSFEYEGKLYPDDIYIKTIYFK